MRDLAAQVTSSLLRFPKVTIDALGEDEVTLDSVLLGRFTVGKTGLAWLACGPHLEVVYSLSGERFSAYRFSGLSEHPPTVLAVRDFSWLKRTGLLVGIQESEGSMLCLYDLGISRVVKAVAIPGRITAIEPLVSYGGASANTQHLHQSLRWFFGVAAVVTDIGHVLLVDLCLDDLSCSQSELEASDLEIVNKSPSEIPRLREGVTQQGRHLCLQLSSPSGSAVTSLQYIHRTNQLAAGFSDGYLQLWNMKTLKKEYHSQLDGGRVPVYAFTFQEPENDPRNCCYLWAVQSAQDHECDVVSLHLLQLAFGERKCLASGKIIYEGLEYCEERYSQDLNGTAFPLRAQATNTRLIGCQTIEKFRHHSDRDDSMNEVASPDTSVSVFIWQVKSYGQGQPSTFIGVFDINRWYHAQMPDSLRAGESLRNCPYLAVWSLDGVMETTARNPVMDVQVHERSLSRGLFYTCPPPEQFFSPTTYNFEGSCLLAVGIVHFTCSGHQKEALSYLRSVTPSLSDSISTGYTRCLVSGLLSSRFTDVQASSLSQEEQLEAILCTAVETSSLGFITGCIKQWTAEEQPGTAVNLRYILEWAWNKVVHTKEELDDTCAPLFDNSANFTDPQTLQLLQHRQRLLANLSTVFHCLLSEAHELTQKGLLGLLNKCLVSSLISQYAQVVLWFCRTGLLPEGPEDDVTQISRPFYSHSIIKNYYISQREELCKKAKDKWSADCLMIDGLVSQCGDRLAELWRRDEGGTGKYPPSSLHALLDIYLLENIEESAKHAIVIYLLLDVMYSFPNKSGASVESFPTAFAIPIGLVKLVQGLWLLDHHDHESSMELLLHPSTSNSLWSWQHQRVLQALMCQQKHSTALRYLHVMKPSLCSTQHAKLCLSVLLHNRCIVEAWALIREQCNKLNMEEMMRFLFEACQELGLMKDLLKLPLSLSEQECLQRFLQTTGGFQNQELLMVHYLQQANYVPALQLNQTLKLNLAMDRDPKMKEKSSTRNSILNQYGKVLPRVQRKLAVERSKPYQHPPTIHREVKRPQPLSTVAKRSTSDHVMTRATFINNVLSKIDEVWVAKNLSPDSPSQSSTESEAPVVISSPPNQSEAFVGTPINMLHKRVSRLLDLVAHPSAQNSPALHGSPSRSKYPWASPKSVSKAPELSLLQTPQVVKRARALASAPVFSAFTPQSILRSSLRPTPVATPSASPGRSITPPVRPKESRITFIEEKEEEEEEEEEEAASLPRGAIRWDRETPKRSSPPPKAWSEESDAEEEMEVNETHSPPLVIRDGLDVESDGEIPEQDLSSLLRPCLGHEAGPIPNQSDTTLEFHHAPVAVESLREPGQNDSVDWEVTVRLPNSSEDDVPPEDNLSEVKPPEILTLDTEVHNTEEVSEKPSDSQTERLGLEVGENDISLVENVTEDQCKEAEVLDLKPNGFESKLVPVQEPSVEVLELPGQEPSVEILEVSNKEPNIQTVEVPVLETNAEVMKLPVQQPNVDGLQRSEHEIPETEESANTSSIFFEALSVPPLTEQNLESSEEGLITVSHQAEATQEPVGESSVVMFPAVEMENDEAEAEVEEHKEESMETSDLDVFVEQQLFGADLFAPSIRDASVSSFENEPVYKPEEVHPAAENPTETLIFTSDLPPTESRSVPVVTLHDSDDLSSVDSAGDSEDEKCGEESVEEDSGSEVEIIEEVQGNGRSHHQLHPAVYLEELPQHQQYFPEESNAVLAMVTSQAQVEDGDVPDEHSELMMVDFGPADVDGADGACYTELKPSTTLLVPLEMVEVQHRDLLDGEPLQTPDVMLPEDSNGFTLMLEPDVEDAPQFNHAAELQENVKDLDVESPLTTHDEQAVSEDSPRIPNNTSEEAKDATENEPVVPTNEEQSEEPSSDVTFQPITTAESQTLRQESEPLSNGDAILSPDESHDVLKSIQAENVPCPEESSQAANHLSSSDSRFITDAAEGEVKSICTVSEDVSTIKETRPKSPGRSKSPARSRVAGADVPETMKDLPKSPSRRTRKTVTFPETIDAEAEELMDSQLPSTPRRVTRSAKPLLEPPLPPTPRRSARRADAEETLPASPARRTPQKSTPRKVSRKADGEKVETLSEEAPPPVEIFGEVVDDAPEDQIQSKMQASPGRVTRKSTRGLALGCLQDPAEDQLPVTPPRSRRTSRASPSRRLTRSQHWSQAEEEQQSLENTQSDALAQRLQKDVENSVPAVTEIIHARRRTTRSLAQPQSSAVEEMVSVGEEPVRKPVSRRSRAQKAAEENLEAGDGSITAQTDLRRTRGKKEVATKPLEDASPEDSVPLPVVESHLLEETDEANLKEEAAVEAELSKPRKKRTARTKAAAEPPAPVQVSFLSPAASPDKPSSGAASSAGEKPTPSLRMNLRRKRMLDAIFAKPVTRRKKL